MWRWLMGLIAVGASACISNPTPHPGAADSHQGFGDVSGGQAEGPDDDKDGVPDCQEAGGVWADGSCNLNLTDHPVATADATTADEDVASDAYGEAVDGDDGASVTGAPTSDAGPSD